MVLTLRQTLRLRLRVTLWLRPTLIRILADTQWQSWYCDRTLTLRLTITLRLRPHSDNTGTDTDTDTDTETITAPETDNGTITGSTDSITESLRLRLRSTLTLTATDMDAHDTETHTETDAYTENQTVHWYWCWYWDWDWHWDYPTSNPRQPAICKTCVREQNTHTAQSAHGIIISALPVATKVMASRRVWTSIRATRPWQHHIIDTSNLPALQATLGVSWHHQSGDNNLPYHTCDDHVSTSTKNAIWGQIMWPLQTKCWRNA